MGENAIDRELLERLLGYQVATLKKFDYIGYLLEKILMHQIELNASMRTLNQVSGANPKVTDTQMTNEIEIHEEFEKKFRDRLSKPALEKKAR